MARSDFRFVHPLRVRWSEVDLQGVVFNGHYLNYFDVAMTEYMRDLGFPYPQGLIDNGTDLYVRKATVEYLDEVRFDNMLDICTRVSKIGNSSLTFTFEVYRAGEDDLLIHGSNVYVNVEVSTRRSAPLPPGLTGAIARREEAAAPAGTPAAGTGKTGGG